jgi:hypothetical protein
MPSSMRKWAMFQTFLCCGVRPLQRDPDHSHLGRVPMHRTNYAERHAPVLNDSLRPDRERFAVACLDVCPNRAMDIGDQLLFIDRRSALVWHCCMPPFRVYCHRTFNV